jgi:nucleoside-diphosphate-sugar epimerase
MTQHPHSNSELPNSELHVIFGTGPLGRATASALVSAGRNVMLVNRSGRLEDPPAGVALAAADLCSPHAAARVCEGATALYFCAQPAYHRWQQEFPALQQGMLDVASAVGARLIVAENLYGYGPVQAPMAESSPSRPNTRKGSVRAEMHVQLMRAHEAGKITVAVARGSDFFGPWVEGSAAGSRMFRAIVAGKPVEVFGDPDLPHTYTFVEDFGAALGVLGTDARSAGQVWHVPNASPVSTRRFLEIAGNLAEKKIALRKTSHFELGLLGLFVPPVREMIEMLYEFESPFVVDHRKFVSTFGDLSTPLEAALTKTIAWTREAIR